MYLLASAVACTLSALAHRLCDADLGQGVNAALLDVGTLARCLNEHPDDVSAALAEYEDVRLPEIRALIRLMQVCACHWTYPAQPPAIFNLFFL